VQASNLPTRFFRDGVVLISDQVVPQHMWTYVRPKAGDVDLCIVPHGSDVLKTVAMIAIMAGTALISGGALAPLFGPTAAAALGLGAGGIGASVAATAFSCGGTWRIV
jgi:hypothetical protein